MDINDIEWGTYVFLQDLDNQRIRMRFPIMIAGGNAHIEDIPRGKRVMLIDLDGQRALFKFPVAPAQDQEVPEVEHLRPAPASPGPDTHIVSQARLAGPGTGIPVEDEQDAKREDLRLAGH